MLTVFGLFEEAGRNCHKESLSQKTAEVIGNE
jgi:hypothetical protein